MFKKIIGSLVFIVITLNSAFAATDVLQELDSKGGTLKINENLTMNYGEDTFNETVVFTARTVSQLEGDLDLNVYEDKSFEILYLSLKNNIGLSAELSKPISLAYNNISQFENPVLVTFSDGLLERYEGTDQGGTFVFSILDSIDGVFTIVDNVSGEDMGSTNTEDGLFGNEEELELNSAPDEMKNTTTSNEPVSVTLSDKPVKGAQNYYLVLLFLILLVGSFIFMKSSKIS